MLNETRRVKKKIKTQQMPQEQVKQIVSDGKALKTTMFLVPLYFACFQVLFMVSYALLWVLYNTIQYNTLFIHATSRSDKNSLK